MSSCLRAIYRATARRAVRRPHTPAGNPPAWRARLALVLAGACVAFGCSSSYSMRRVADARHPVAEQGLTLAARFEGERRDPGTRLEDFVPVVVGLANAGSRAVRVRMEDISLVDDRGTRFRPLPIFAGRGPFVASSGVTRGVDDVSWPSPKRRDGARFLSQRQIAANRAPATIVIIPQETYWKSAPASAYVVDQGRVSSFPLRAIDLVTLPEGVLEPGNRAMGYVYFSRHARHPGRLRLVWDARTAEGERVAQLSLPAEVSADP